MRRIFSQSGAEKPPAMKAKLHKSASVDVSAARGDERQIKAKIIAQLINPKPEPVSHEAGGHHVNFELDN